MLAAMTAAPLRGFLVRETHFDRQLILHFLFTFVNYYVALFSCIFLWH